MQAVLDYVLISTHTLTWSVTCGVVWYAIYRVISTHTLTWSVTFTFINYYTPFLNFNSHAHVERDTIFSAPVAEFFNFNSHAHVERDKKDQYPYRVKVISTHTLTWSVTYLNMDGFNVNIFQLTRSRGA